MKITYHICTWKSHHIIVQEHPAGPRRTVHWTRPSSARPCVDGRSCPFPATDTFVAMEEFYRESMSSPILGQSLLLTPMRLRLPLPRCSRPLVLRFRSHENVLATRSIFRRCPDWLDYAQGDEGDGLATMSRPSSPISSSTSSAAKGSTFPLLWCVIASFHD
jgi:hypothetical protein